MRCFGAARGLALAFALWPVGTLADPPRVVADIAPVHALVARVMQGVGRPTLILPPGTSPHGYSLRPSQARALENAELVFWIGRELTPWFEDVIAAVASTAKSVALIESDGTLRLGFRQGPVFGSGEADHAHAHTHDHAHDHFRGGVDPHAWLAPENAKLWLDVIARELSARDPSNAALYGANALAGRRDLDLLVMDLDLELAPVRDRGFVVFHDAYHYFEQAFFIEARGAISESDARAPGAKRILDLRRSLAAAGVVCVFSEPQYPPNLVTAIAEDSDIGHGVLDPMGSALVPGPALYPAILRGLADELVRCLGR